MASVAITLSIPALARIGIPMKDVLTKGAETYEEQMKQIRRSGKENTATVDKASFSPSSKTEGIGPPAREKERRRTHGATVKNSI
jgi:hypothetical protein